MEWKNNKCYIFCVWVCVCGLPDCTTFFHITGMRRITTFRSTTECIYDGRKKTSRFLSWNKMKNILPFYANLLLKLSLTQSILITTFTSWIQCLWGGVPCCQHILPSVYGSSASLVAACREKLLPLLSDVPFQIHRRPWFFFVYRALEISSEQEVLRLGTLVPMNIEVPTKYPLSQDRIVVFEICLHSKSPMLYRQRSMATQMLWVSLEERSRTNSARQRFHSQLFLQNRQVFLPDPVL